jgi:hypothetical protein
MQPSAVALADSVDDLVAGAIRRQRVRRDDGKSGSILEAVEMGGERFFLKTASYEDDWICRVAGDRRGWPAILWRSGFFDQVPDCIDHTVVAMALEGSGQATCLAQLMCDVGPQLVAEGGEAVALDTHRRFLDHMGAMHGRFWGWEDRLGLMPMENRLRLFAPDTIAFELPAPDVPEPIALADIGWRRLAERAPGLHALVERVHAAPSLVTEPLGATPSTFLHGDWKLGNLGEQPDGRTILLDWSLPGAGPGCYDLGWYLALNAARVPESKEAAIDAYLDALEVRGVDTADWWDAQFGLSMVAVMATFAWEKAVGDDDELRWWEAAASDGARWLR